MSKTVIMVCAHKRDACLAEPPYLPVQVGRAIAREDLGYTGDDSGENISAKNRNYCELTAQYWAWKNRSDADYIGLCHYRRYFDFGSRSLANVKTRTPAEFFASAHPVPDMDRVFRRYDVVLGRPKYYPYNLYTDYSGSTSARIWTCCARFWAKSTRITCPLSIGSFFAGTGCRISICS